MTRWVRFCADDEAIRMGRLADGHIAEFRGELFGESYATGRSFAIDAVRLGPPCAPGKVIALWNNFGELGQKLGKAPPSHPLFLLKPASSVIGTGAPIVRPARYAGKIVFEGELGIVIGKRCSNVSIADAAQYIFGYTCVNDVTASDLLAENPDFAQWTRAKGCDTFCCLGPAIATSLDWSQARVVTTLDGVERQNYPLSDLIFSPVQIVSHLSGDMTLMPGDVIACGTSLGVGSMKPGSSVCVTIAGVGELRNTLAG